MSRSSRNPTTGPRDEGELVRWAGEAPELPELDIEALSESVTGAWRRTVRRRQQRRVMARIAAVTVPAILAFAWFLSLGRGSMVAQLEGTRSLPENLAFQAAEKTLRSGAVMETGEALWMVRHRAGHRFRIGSESRVVLMSQDQLRLERGWIYVDAAASDLTISTPSAEVSHIGTRYEVRVLESGQTRARVREGRVVLRSHEKTVELKSAEGADVAMSGVFSPLPDDVLEGDWQWIEDAYLPLGISNPTVMDVLEWAADQTSRRLEVDRELWVEEERGALTRVTGLPADIRPLRAVEAVVAGSDLSLTIRDDVLIVRAKP